GFVQLLIRVGYHAKNRDAQHFFQFIGSDIEAFGRAVENQPDAAFSKAAVEQRLNNLFGLVQRGDLEGGHQAGLVDLLQGGHGDAAQAAAQVDQAPVVVRPGEGHNVADLVAGGLQFGGEHVRGGHDLDVGNAIGDQGLPVMNVQPVQIGDGVQDGINGLGFGDESDHAGVHVEVHQENLLIEPAELGGHMADQSAGAAAAFRGEEGESLAAAGGARFAPPAALGGTFLQGPLERVVQRRKQ